MPMIQLPEWRAIAICWATVFACSLRTICAVANAQEDPACCCTPHALPTCTDAQCTKVVCAFDPFCCEFAWDEFCVKEAVARCGTLCTQDCDGVVGADACYIGAPASQTTGSPLTWSDPTNWTNGVAGPGTTVSTGGEVSLDCDHQAASINSSGSLSLFMAGNELRVGGGIALGWEESINPYFYVEGPGRLTGTNLTVESGVTSAPGQSLLLLSPAVDAEFSDTLTLVGDIKLKVGAQGPATVQTQRLEMRSDQLGRFPKISIAGGSVFRLLEPGEFAFGSGTWWSDEFSTWELGGPLRMLPGSLCHASGHFVTPAVWNHSYLHARLAPTGNSSMRIDGDFHNSSYGSVRRDPPGTFYLETTESGDPDGPIIQAGGTASLGGQLHLRIDSQEPPRTMELIKCDHFDPMRPGFDTVTIDIGGKPLPQNLQTRFTTSVDGSNGQETLSVEIVPAVPLTFTLDSNTSPSSRCLRVSSFDGNGDYFDEMAVSVVNDQTGEYAMRVYPNVGGVIGASYTTTMMSGYVIDQAVCSIDSESGSELLVLTWPFGLIAWKLSDEGLEPATPEQFVPEPDYSYQAVAICGLRANGLSEPEQVVVAFSDSSENDSESSIVRICSSTGQSEWSVDQEVEVPGTIRCMASGDIDRDALFAEEIVVGTRQKAVHTIGKVDGKWVVKQCIALGGYPLDIVVDRIDSDQYAEIVVVNDDAMELPTGANADGSTIYTRASMQVLRNAGASAPGVIVAAVPHDIGLGARRVVTFDPDGDGDRDMAVVTSSWPSEMLKIRNDSSAGTLFLGAPESDEGGVRATDIDSARMGSALTADVLQIQYNPSPSLLGTDWCLRGLGSPPPQWPPGDFDHDLDVDGNDLTALMSAWGTPDRDINGDNLVDGLDLSFVLTNWGSPP